MHIFRFSSTSSQIKSKSINEHPAIIIEKKDTVSGNQAFFLSWQIKSWKFWKAFKFNIRDILPKLFTNLKEKDQVCYLLFSVETLPDEMCDSVVSILKVNLALSLASHFLTLYSRGPAKIPWGWKDGEEKHLLILKENTIANIGEIISFISCRDFECYLIFDSEANRDKLFAEIKSLYENNSLEEKNIVSLSPEVIKYATVNWTEQLFFYTTRFDLEQFKNLVRDSVGLNNFEVITK